MCGGFFTRRINVYCYHFTFFSPFLPPFPLVVPPLASYLSSSSPPSTHYCLSFPSLPSSPFLSYFSSLLSLILILLPYTLPLPSYPYSSLLACPKTSLLRLLSFPFHQNILLILLSHSFLPLPTPSPSSSYSFFPLLPLYLPSTSFLPLCSFFISLPLPLPLPSPSSSHTFLYTSFLLPLFYFPSSSYSYSFLLFPFFLSLSSFYSFLYTSLLLPLFVYCPSYSQSLPSL